PPEYRERGLARKLTPAFATFAAVAIGFALAGVQMIPLVEHLAAQKTSEAQSIDWHGLPWGFSLMHAGGATPAAVGFVPALVALFALAFGWRRSAVVRWVVIGLGVPVVSFLLAKALAGSLPPAAAHVFFGPASLAPSILALTMLAGLGLDDMPRLWVDPRRAMGFARGLVIAAIAFAATGLIVASVGGFVRVRHPFLTGEGFRLAGVGVVAFLTAALIIWRAGHDSLSRVLPWAFVSLAMAELLVLAIPFLTTTTRRAVFPSSSTIDALGRSIDSSRCGAAVDVLPPDLATGIDLPGLNDIRASGDFGSSPVDEWLSSPVNAGGARRMLNVRYQVAPAGASASAGNWQTLFSNDRATIFEDPAALPRAWVARRTEHYAWRSEVLDRMSKPWDFDPRETVIVDDEMYN